MQVAQIDDDGHDGHEQKKAEGRQDPGDPAVFLEFFISLNEHGPLLGLKLEPLLKGRKLALLAFFLDQGWRCLPSLVLMLRLSINLRMSWGNFKGDAPVVRHFFSPDQPKRQKDGNQEGPGRREKRGQYRIGRRLPNPARRQSTRRGYVTVI
jgi:hypothetical protein